eukprot:2846301-Pyramimonas_sp.AAC.1
MVPWKSRWSRVRLVNTATSKLVPSVRPRDSACEDTSIATAVHSCAAIPAYSCCSCRASGVVFGTSYRP